VRDEGIEFYPLKGEPEYLMSFMVDHPGNVPSLRVPELKEMITLDPTEIRRKQEMMEEIYVC
jgi:hypothetical protein